MTRTKVVSSYYSRTAVEIYIFCLMVKCDSENSELVKVLGPQDFTIHLPLKDFKFTNFISQSGCRINLLNKIYHGINI